MKPALKPTYHGMFATRRSLFTAHAAMIGLAALVTLYAAWLALRFADQPPLEWHDFRQTQTALTAYWFAKDGFRLAYETPVAGTPWSIPFEFPLYQLLVVWVSKLPGMSLDMAGRTTSFAFLALCLWPARSVIRRLVLPDTTFWCFVALTFSTPIYVFWGRSFMIETTALFFALASIKYFLDIMLDAASGKRMALFVVFASLAVLQKATTGLPVLMVLTVVYCIHRLTRLRSLPAFVLDRKTWTIGVCVVASVLIGYAWVRFSDANKAINPLGQHMTSYMLSPFNFGTLQQRWSQALWTDVIWVRMFCSNAGSLLGLFLLLSPFVIRSDLKTRSIVATAIVLALWPLMLFTNLHIVHDYYQSANLMFLSFAIATAISTVIDSTIGPRAALVCVALIVVSNILVLRSEYQPKIGTTFDKEHRDVAIGSLLRRELPEGKQFVAFGNSWSSTFAYLSRRKSFTVPVWLPAYQKIAAHPERYVEQGALGAVVACEIDHPSLSELMGWATADGRSWKMGETRACLIATPEATYRASPSSQLKQITCKGNIELARVEDRGGTNVILLGGWALLKGNHVELPGRVFFEISAEGRKPEYFEALRTPRPDVNKAAGLPMSFDAGYSRILTANTLPPGKYQVRLIDQSTSGSHVCNLVASLSIPVH